MLLAYSFTIHFIADSLSEATKAQIKQLVSSIKSEFSDIVKKHRDVHASISKFKKTVDKVSQFDCNFTILS